MLSRPKVLLAEQGAALPEYVEQEFEEDPKCGRIEHGFLILLCNRIRLAMECPQQGHCSNVLLMVSTNQNRQVAIDVGSLRRIGPSPARAEADR